MSVVVINYLNMIKIILSGLLVFLCLSSFSQVSDINVIHTKKIVGRNLVNNSIIKADNYYYPQNIRQVYVDPKSNLLTVQQCRYGSNNGLLKNKGRLLVCTLSDGKVIWEKKVFYHTSRFQQKDNRIIQTIDHTSSCISSVNGVSIWKAENNISYIDKKYDIAIGYKYKEITGYPNVIQGIDIRDGKVLWERKIKKEYGWNDIMVLNDSVRIIVAAGLHAVNIKTGKGWDYDAITGEENFKLEDKMPNGVTGCVEYSGVFTDANTVKGIVSNVLIQDNDIYVASRDKISRINKTDGSLIWSKSLEEDFTSKTSLFIQGNNIYMINYAYAFYKNEQRKYGIPYIAAYNKDTGRQKFFFIIEYEEGFLRDYSIKDEKLILVTSEKIYEYSLMSGWKVGEKEINTVDEGDMMRFVGTEVYAEKNENRYAGLTDSDTRNNYVFTNKNKVLVLDSDYNIVKRISCSGLFGESTTYQDFAFLSKRNKTLVINKEGKKVAELYLSNKAFIKGKKIYDIQKNSLIVVDLNSVIKK